ncbi:1b17cf36-88af-412e-ac06-4498dc00a1a5 [Thermothielavioides terrestris]|uniref:1b17cf36-88af-412e-ac06-4498dc00a1a5 n=1 Tax=Thermothielavioides terrestris TaxID=2587410 RepID=A0A3S4F5E1_9PEZI|nr:1b17cf36-88af-412e-ac06-4498dc00a1a5 [Thermothielavioides terrestris]
MSSVASQASGGGSAAPEQSGTAAAVTDFYATHIPQHIPDFEYLTSSTLADPVDHAGGSEGVNNDDSDFDSVFGDLSELNEILAGGVEDEHNENSTSKEDIDTNGHSIDKEKPSVDLSFPISNPKSGNSPQTPVKNAGNVVASGAHSYGERLGSGRRTCKATVDQLTFPTVNTDSATHEESPNIRTSGTTTIASNQTASNGVALTDNILSADDSAIDPLLTSSPNAANPPPETPTSKSTIPPSASPGDFIGLPNGSVPKADFGCSVIFGPELQKALFNDGEATADPKLPGSEATSTPVPPGQQPIRAARIIVEEDITAPATPERPPATPPRLVNIPIHNAMPAKPDTPLADQLRAEFWEWHRKDTQLLYEYKLAYRAWKMYIASEDNKASPDYEAKSEELMTTGINTQVAWAKHHRSFENWKAANPAVEFIINNIHNDLKAFNAAEKEKTQRAEFVKELRGKDEEVQKTELTEYDNWLNLIKQARLREIWRDRVEAQTKAEAMIKAQRQAVIDEQNRIAAEEARKKAEAEAEERRKQAEAEAEEERKKAAAKAEEERQAAAAKAAEEERAFFEAMSAALAAEGIGMQNSGGDDWGAQLSAPEGNSDNFEQQFQEAFQLQDGSNLLFDEPFDFERIFAGQEAQPQTAEQSNVEPSVLGGTDLNGSVPFPEFPFFDGQADGAMDQDFFSADVQAQFPAIPEVTSVNANTSIAQAEETNNLVPAEHPGDKIKPRDRKGKAAANAQPSNELTLGFPSTAPGPIQQHQAPQTADASFGLDQVRASDPFVLDGVQFSSVNHDQSMASTSIPSTVQAPYGPVGGTVQQPEQAPAKAQASSAAGSPAAQQNTQVLADYSIFMAQPSQSARRSPAVSSLPGRSSGTPENKRKASHGMETPTKRRQSVNQQGAIVPIAQPPPLPAATQGVPTPVQGVQTPARTVQVAAQVYSTPPQVPIDPALHFGVTPPSRYTTFGTAIKAGVCAVVKAILTEARTHGTVLTQVLLDGPDADFGTPETKGRIKQATRTYLDEVNASNPESDRQAFNSGAYKAFHGIVREIEQHGTVFGKELLVGQPTGHELLAVKRSMATRYREVIASYTSPPRVDNASASSAQIQQTPTRGSRTASQQNDMVNTPTMAGSPVQAPASSPPQNGHASSSASPHPYPLLPLENGSSPQVPGYGASSSQIIGYDTPSYQQQGVPAVPAGAASAAATVSVNEILDRIASRTPSAQQQQEPKKKKTPAPRKPRARKSSSTAAAAAASSTNPGDNPYTPTNAPIPTPGSASGSKSNNNNTKSAGSKKTGHCIPKIYYRFSDQAFYMVLQHSQTEEQAQDAATTAAATGAAPPPPSHHRVGRGTAATEAALGRFLAAARERLGVEQCPAWFVYRDWLGLERNLEDLHAAVYGGAAAAAQVEQQLRREVAGLV